MVTLHHPGFGGLLQYQAYSCPDSTTRYSLYTRSSIPYPFIPFPRSLTNPNRNYHHRPDRYRHSHTAGYPGSRR